MRCRMGNLRLGWVMFTLIGLVYVCEPVHAQEFEFARSVESVDVDSSDDLFTRAEKELGGKQVILELLDEKLSMASRGGPVNAPWFISRTVVPEAEGKLALPAAIGGH